MKIFLYLLSGILIGAATALVFITARSERTVTFVIKSVPTPTVIPTTTQTPTPSPIPTHAPKPTPVITKEPVPTPSPTPTPTPKPPINVPQSLEQLFNEMALKYHADAALLKRIADCESHFNSGVVSRNGLYAGMFQFDKITWINNRKLMRADSNPDLRFGARESIETAAFMISQGRSDAWSACKN